MPRHLADHAREDAATGTPTGAPGDVPEGLPGGARLVRFLRLDRAEGLHPAVRALHARRPAGPAEGRLRPFLRILRGRLA